MADPVFYLEADGHTAVRAQMARGGYCTPGSLTHWVILVIPDELEPGVEYHLRPRNDNRRYRWALAGDLVVVAG